LQVLYIWRHHPSCVRRKGEQARADTWHKDVTVAGIEKKTPETVSSYNETKYAVHILDQPNG